MSVIENLLVAQHMQVNRNLLAGIFNTRGYRKAENRALDRAFYWLEVVGWRIALTCWRERSPTGSSGGWRLPARCVPGQR
jgi:ABC-type branched-subunit amino acid transport system ATPase component